MTCDLMSSSFVISVGVASCNNCNSCSATMESWSGRYRCGERRSACVVPCKLGRVRISLVVMEHCEANLIFITVLCFVETVMDVWAPEDH